MYTEYTIKAIVCIVNVTFSSLLSVRYGPKNPRDTRQIIGHVFLSGIRNQQSLFRPANISTAACCNISTAHAQVEGKNVL